MKCPPAKAASLRVLSLVVFALAACGRADSGATADSALARDLALAGQQTSVAPTFMDTTIAPAPEPERIKSKPAVVEREPAPKPRPAQRTPQRTPEPAPRPVAQTPPPQPQPQPILAVPAPAPIVTGPAVARAEIGAGTGAGLTSGSKVCSATNLPGDKIVATLNEPITGTGGASIPAGSAVVLEVASVTSGENADAQVAFRVRSIVVNDKTYNVDASVAPAAALEKSKVSDPNAGSDKTKVIGGAIAGAILGQMIGHNTKGTIIGAAAGAAAGAAVSKSGEKWQACLPAGAPLRLTLNAPLVISS